MLQGNKLMAKLTLKFGKACLSKRTHTAPYMNTSLKASCCQAEDPGDERVRTSGVLAVEGRSLKAACQNAVVLSVLLLTDTFNERLVHIILSTNSVIKAWHAEQSLSLRSCQSSVPWLKLQFVEGKYVGHCCDILAKLQSTSCMEKCGFHTSANMASY